MHYFYSQMHLQSKILQNEEFSKTAQCIGRRVQYRSKPWGNCTMRPIN